MHDARSGRTRHNDGRDFDESSVGTVQQRGPRRSVPPPTPPSEALNERWAAATTQRPHGRDDARRTIHRHNAIRPSRARIGGYEARDIPTARVSEPHAQSHPSRPTLRACVGIESRDATYLLFHPASVDERFWSALEC